MWMAWNRSPSWLLCASGAELESCRDDEDFGFHGIDCHSLRVARETEGERGEKGFRVNPLFANS